ncbi:MAG: anti-sigma factor [Verrucomicrobia bacterium]|nr:anti-sigma factor [Verrucomicrobiota bacterium]
MNCEECQDFLEAYLDNELDAAATILVERHLRDCAGCRERLGVRQGLSALLKDPQLRFEVPDSLRTKVLAALPAPVPTDVKPRPQTKLIHPWFAFPLGLAAAVMLVFGAVTLSQNGNFSGSRERTLARQVVSSHIRSLLASHLLDVPSTDQHTVKPWFAGKLKFSPPVQDFAERGFSLTGGRLDYIDGHEVAAVIYHRRQHVINLFIWPVAAGRTGAPVRSFSEDGYNVVHWDRDGFSFWAVSDVRLEDLQAFADLEMQAQ